MLPMCVPDDPIGFEYCPFLLKKEITLRWVFGLITELLTYYINRNKAIVAPLLRLGKQIIF